MSAPRPEALWLIAGGPMQRPALDIAKRLGVALIVSDGLATSSVGAHADDFVHADTFDLAAHKAAASFVLERFDVRGVFTFAADCHVTVAGLADHLGLHGVPVDLATTCRNKDACRAVLAAAGLYQPRCLATDSVEAARTFAAKLARPVVLKATDNSGSRGFFPVPDGTVIDDADFERARGFGTRGLVIVEERLSPIRDGVAEQSVESAWVDGEFIFLNWVDRLFPRDIPHIAALAPFACGVYPDGVELGHVNPSTHGESTRAAVERAVRATGVALGFDKLRGGHILKADIMLTPDGPVVIEATPRLSGGWDSSGTTLARGGAVIEAAMRMALGETDMKVLGECFRYAKSSTVAAVVASIPDGAVDCIGRRFALATGATTDDALNAAWRELELEHFLA